ncbi:hypothetical protein D9615_009227 [Tricholomella constricta]|uniref:HAMP domain-containing protein n=1 Tax=Tricholomella constricta TaxID=117010 RepID=A0A8H5GWF2_9AGAR|nr:hypothetical protein D9615_009227 [Tricholomella constricta]
MTTRCLYSTSARMSTTDATRDLFRVHLLRLLTAAANNDARALDYEFDTGNDLTAQAILKSLDALIARVCNVDSANAFSALRIIAPQILDPTAIHCPTCGHSSTAVPPSSPSPFPTFDSEHDEVIFLRSRGQELTLLREQVQELQSLKGLLQDVARVCNAVARGDLSQKITVPVQSVDVQGEMLDLKMTINSMVVQLSTLANEVTRVSSEVGAEGMLGGQVFVPEVQGMWKVRSIADVTKAVAGGDLTKKIDLDVRGEILELKQAVNGISSPNNSTQCPHTSPPILFGTVLSSEFLHLSGIFCTPNITSRDCEAFEPRASIPEKQWGAPIVFLGHAVPLDENEPVWDDIRDITTTSVVNDVYGCEITEAVLCIGDNYKRSYGVTEAQTQKKALKALLGEPLWYLSLIKSEWSSEL